ncbi:MAG: NAD(+)/NADH kinase [Thermoguttaceae bacterium]|nr:NAD(+)/NADH kinase [Thermoguttaceae bacterium]
MMKAILLGNGSRQGVLEGVALLRPGIESVVDVVVSDFENAVDLSEVKADVALVFGGDGSILRAVHQMGENQIPILAVNLGTFGFLSNVEPDSMVAFLKSSHFKDFEVREQLLLNCSVWRKKVPGEPIPPCHSVSSNLHTCAEPTDWGGDSSDRYCFSNNLVVNEVSIRCGKPFSILKIDLAVDGDRVTTFRGDGLILATPVGSTGHSLSAGGPILRNDLEAVLITPFSPQTLSFRPVVDSASRVYELQAPTGEVFLVVDGAALQKLLPDDHVVIRRAPFSFKMICVPEDKYYRNLQAKLAWGVDSVTRNNENKR